MYKIGLSPKPHLMSENILLDMLIHWDMCICKFIRQSMLPQEIKHGTYSFLRAVLKPLLVQCHTASEWQSCCRTQECLMLRLEFQGTLTLQQSGELWAFGLLILHLHPPCPWGRGRGLAVAALSGGHMDSMPPTSRRQSSQSSMKAGAKRTQNFQMHSPITRSHDYALEMDVHWTIEDFPRSLGTPEVFSRTPHQQSAASYHWSDGRSHNNVSIHSFEVVRKKWYKSKSLHIHPQEEFTQNLKNAQNLTQLWSALRIHWGIDCGTPSRCPNLQVLQFFI